MNCVLTPAECSEGYRQGLPGCQQHHEADTGSSVEVIEPQCPQKAEQPAFFWFLMISLIAVCTGLSELTGESSLCAEKLEELGFLILPMPLADPSEAPRKEQGRRGPAAFSSCSVKVQPRLLPSREFRQLNWP